MAIYEIQTDKIVSFDQTTFEAVGLRERNDLQRLLKAQIDIVFPDEDVLVISEGFREWESSRRELDLLAIDKQANLVVIELKRTEDAGHAELQAIRYAAMVSAMTFRRAVGVYDDYLRKNGRDGDAESQLLEFLNWEEPDEDDFAQDVRIVLVSANFSKELTTSVMWLNERNLDIRCVRMRPYRDGARVLVDVQQVIPLPEASAYIERIRDKAVQERQDKAERESRHSLRLAFWQALLERVSGESQLFSNKSASDETWIAAGSGVSGLHYTYTIRQHSTATQLKLEASSKSVNKARFDWLLSRREQIEANADGHHVDTWSCGVTRQIAPGDRAFLMRLGKPPKGIMGSGIVLTEPEEGEHWDPDRAAAGDTGIYVKIMFDVLSDTPLIGEDLLSTPPLSSQNWYPHASGTSIPSEVASVLESEWTKATGTRFAPLTETELASVYLEGTRRTRLITSCERNPMARVECIAHHGARCTVCGLAFDERYGDIGAGFIQVHHLIPIADIGDEYEVDPVHDLCPVCPNCHAMLHKRPKPFTPDELKQMMEASTKMPGGMP